MSLKNRAGSLLCGLCLVWMASVVQADFILFTDRAAFDAFTAAGVISTEDFDTASDFPSGATLTGDGFTVSETGGTNIMGLLPASLLGANGLGGANTSGPFAVAMKDDGSSVLTFAFDSPVNAFGFDITSSADTTVSVGGGFDGSFGLTAGVPTFFGVVDTMGMFDTLTFDASGDPLLAFDTVSSGLVPEPTGIALMACGVAGLLGFSIHYRRRELNS